MKKTAMAAVLSMALCSFLYGGPGRSAENSGAPDGKDGLETVDYVDVEKYMGTFYEIATIPAFFQRNCAHGTTATYSLNDDGTVKVVNRCYTDKGKLQEAEGEAWVADPKTNAKLKVSFAPFFKKRFAGDYWIIELGPNYSYAVVGHPSREYGWILSRSPEMPDEVLRGIIARLEERGYDFSKFELTEHK